MNHHDYMLHQDLSGQLAAQAETIASLTSQRDLLIREAAEAHASWQVERDGWERSAEALIKQRTLVMAMHKEAVSSFTRVHVLAQYSLYLLGLIYSSCFIRLWIDL